MKFGFVVIVVREIRECTDRQAVRRTCRQTDRHAYHNTPLLYCGRSMGATTGEVRGSPKFGCNLQTDREIVSQTDMQIDRHAYYNTPLMYWGQSMGATTGGGWGVRTPRNLDGPQLFT